MTGMAALASIELAFAACTLLALTEAPAMRDKSYPPIRMEIDRREDKVTVTLIGRERTKERFSYILEVTGSSRSRLAASYIGGSASRIVNRTSFPDTPPWRITFQISDGRNRLVHSEEVPDH